ncbi:hypothetical protein PoB_003631500 [Plakobranchus ocellatus]|uniref:Uncharacterized protein n=1 Tax=Plakobranchus ocellatus TaxID=259542 RepID=A0AAV4ASE0_9GAST|nr:hypothetical protein PoB_003631500 [Plakobranchus ocellatus]
MGVCTSSRGEKSLRIDSVNTAFEKQFLLIDTSTCATHVFTVPRGSAVCIKSARCFHPESNTSRGSNLFVYARRQVKWLFVSANCQKFLLICLSFVRARGVGHHQLMALSLLVVSCE